jgi:hypothetical protein
LLSQRKDLGWRGVGEPKQSVEQLSGREGGYERRQGDHGWLARVGVWDISLSGEAAAFLWREHLRVRGCGVKSASA